jgi:CDP-diacylglycerol--glycerol-3-phosphate 3-phosphatidyltransferase
VTLYDLKPRFQDLLRPLVATLARMGITANQVTLLAAAGSVLLGILLVLAPARVLFLLLPLWLFIRMALNAIDGMLAREFGQKSALGAYLNEICDVVSDAALYLPFAMLAPFSPAWVVVVVMLAALTEFAGVLGPGLGASRRYDGPLGKSDRAFVFGALAFWIGIGGAMPDWLGWIMPLIAVLLAATVARRVVNGLAEARRSA